VRAGDDPALSRLAEYLSQPHDGHRARGDNVGQDLTSCCHADLRVSADRAAWFIGIPCSV